jgi:hypothetical protein
LIRKGTFNGKTAIVVAGYDEDDTAKAAQKLMNEGLVEGVFTTSESVA